jgi:hypothetical protein
MERSGSGALATRWRERISRWRQSGLSIAEFCRREQISQPSFFAWRKRLASRVAVRRRDKLPAAGGSGGEARFIELSPPRWPTTNGVQITLPGGAVVALPQDASTELVVAAIRAASQVPAVEARPC